MKTTTASPCIAICVLDEFDICQGCYRSADEITCWSATNEAEKQAILAQANRRRDESQTIQLK